MPKEKMKTPEKVMPVLFGFFLSPLFCGDILKELGRNKDSKELTNFLFQV